MQISFYIQGLKWTYYYCKGFHAKCHTVVMIWQCSLRNNLWRRAQRNMELYGTLARWMYLPGVIGVHVFCAKCGSCPVDSPFFCCFVLSSCLPRALLNRAFIFARQSPGAAQVGDRVPETFSSLTYTHTQPPKTRAFLVFPPRGHVQNCPTGFWHFRRVHGFIPFCVAMTPTRAA